MRRMRLTAVRRIRPTGPAGITGVARLDKRTKNLTKRLKPGDVAVIDHRDLDRVSAEALVACRVSAVVNVAPSISGRYPNLGPEILLAAGVPLVDAIGPEIFHRVSEDDEVTVTDDGTVILGDDQVVGRGIRQTT